MELKNYQKKVLANLQSYLRHYVACGNASEAYRSYLAEDGLMPGKGDIPAYHDTLNGVPSVCIKVPTGGGKTFIAANALSLICDELPERPADVVVWLVPRKEILTQTLRHLRDAGDPLRLVIDRDFAHCVEVLDKEDGLSARGFTSATVTDQLTLFVLSYDSFKNKDGRRAYAENSQLMPLTDYQRKLGLAREIDGADDTSLIAALAGTNPIVIVDESHHAHSELSQEMLRNLNPRFVLELTATPRKGSNVISRATALELKHEEMVKLPVIVYRRGGKNEVVRDAILLQRKLEQVAINAGSVDNGYIRPIVLFQAQSNTSEESETYDKLKSSLIEAGIPESYIAVRTGSIDEIGDQDLMSQDCPIRYIITVEALAEGWDCPFAYVLATVANKSSKISVEQIVGRILRQPYAHRSQARSLNISYVLTSSADFNETIDQVVAGLNCAGFSKRDVHVSEIEPILSRPDATQGMADTLFSRKPDNASADEYGSSFEPNAPVSKGEAIPQQTSADQFSGSTDNPASKAVDDMIQAAEENEQDFESRAEAEAEQDHGHGTGLGNGMNEYGIREDISSSVEELKLPQFMTTESAGLFSLGIPLPFERKMLLEDFDLAKCATDTVHINASGSENVRQVDVDSYDELRVRELNPQQLLDMKKLFKGYSNATKRKTVHDGIIAGMTAQFKSTYGTRGLSEYVSRIVDQMDSDQVDAYVDNSSSYTSAATNAISQMARVHCRKRFNEQINDKIILEPNYTFPKKMVINKPMTIYERTLYEAESGNMNDFERKMAESLSNSDCILWWHRIDERKQGEFCINGFINHYPDFIAMTTSGTILAIETKGEQLINEDTRDKLDLGHTWALIAGQQYRYYMVFDHESPDSPNAMTFNRFRSEILGK